MAVYSILVLPGYDGLIPFGQNKSDAWDIMQLARTAYGWACTVHVSNRISSGRCTPLDHPNTYCLRDSASIAASTITSAGGFVVSRGLEWGHRLPDDVQDVLFVQGSFGPYGSKVSGRGGARMTVRSSCGSSFQLL